MLILTGQDLREILKMRDVIEAVESGFRSLARGDAIAPERLHLNIRSQNGVLLEMPAFMQAGSGGALGTKVVSVFEKNRECGLDIVQSAYLLLDAQTGVPLSLMEGKYITAIRTAATSAVATKYMSSGGGKRLAVFGAGVQARFHIEAMIEAARVERIMIVSRRPDPARELAIHSSNRFGVPAEVVSADEAARAADLICTCTSSPAPLFDGKLIINGAHINAVGAFTPSTRELDSETVLRARVFIDAESAAGREAGEIIIPVSEGTIPPHHIEGTLADVVSGKVTGRRSPEEITLFKSCGLAIEDLVTARLAYDKAIANSAGLKVDL
jgi:alanine dehydrogenase